MAAVAHWSCDELVVCGWYSVSECRVSSWRRRRVGVSQSVMSIEGGGVEAARTAAFDVVDGRGGGGGAGAAVASTVAPPSGPANEPKLKKRKTRRGKQKRPLGRPQWRRRCRNSLPPETHAPYNNNQFLMAEHDPETRDFAVPRTRDSSFSVDSEDDNYFYPLPEDEEDFLTKEFSTVYEDAQSERLMSMTKPDLIREYLSLQNRYEALAKRTRQDAPLANEAIIKIREHEETIRELRAANQALRTELEKARSSGSSVDSESDSSSTTTREESGSEAHDADRRMDAEPTLALNGNG